MTARVFVRHLGYGLLGTGITLLAVLLAAGGAR